MDKVYELFNVIYRNKTSLGLFKSINGAMVPAQGKFDEYWANVEAEDAGAYEVMATELQWELKQVYFSVGRRELPDGDPRWVAQYSPSSSFQIYERQVSA